MKNSIKALACNFLDFDDSKLTQDSKHTKILKDLRKRYAILKPDKRNGRIVLIKLTYYQTSMTALFSDSKKFHKDPP